MIFTANTAIFLLLDSLFTTIFLTTLITLWIIFSVILPLEAPAYFVAKRIPKNIIGMLKLILRSRREDEYDVIIVGSGIGGLTCGGPALEKRSKILVLEQHYQVEAIALLSKEMVCL